MSTDVSEEHIASIFRIEEISSARNQPTSRWKACSLFLAELISSTLKMEAICSSETLVDTLENFISNLFETQVEQMMLVMLVRKEQRFRTDYSVLTVTAGTCGVCLKTCVCGVFLAIYSA
jgi:hypothetical protein